MKRKHPDQKSRSFGSDSFISLSGLNGRIARLTLELAQLSAPLAQMKLQKQPILTAYLISLMGTRIEFLAARFMGAKGVQVVRRRFIRQIWKEQKNNTIHRRTARDSALACRRMQID